jgi:hypothetical protein
MRKLALILCLVLLSSVAFARNIESRSITIDIDGKGDGKIVETYTISLETISNDFGAYDLISVEARNDLAKWQTFLSDIDTALKNPQNLLITSVKQRNFAELTLQYDVPNLAEISEQKGRFTAYNVGEKKFTFYDASNDIFTIPFKTTLWIRLDKDYGILETKPVPSLGPYLENNEVNRYGWSGPLPTSEFLLRYEVETAIAESLDIMKVLALFTDTPVYGITTIIIIVLAYIYRKKLWGIVSEGFAGEEEIESPRRKL